jgi:hypothetical protein
MIPSINLRLSLTNALASRSICKIVVRSYSEE